MTEYNIQISSKSNKRKWRFFVLKDFKIMLYEK